MIIKRYICKVLGRIENFLYHKLHSKVKMKKNHILSLLFLFASFVAFSQQYRHPVDIAPALSANFGELRSNHFHSGLDYKTQQVVNKPIIAIEDGYVARINVSPGGYGLALYIDHPTGHTSVYGHLNSFSKKIADYVKEQQYSQETYAIELYPGEGTLPVKKGEQIALSGNTGGSGGPHLHFEIRDTPTQDALDVLEFVPRITDNQKPTLRGIAFYPVLGKGSINGGSNPIRLTISNDKNGNPVAWGRSINAWGRIGVGVKAYDRMNGQNNIYGVKHVRLFVDNELVFTSKMDKFPFSKTRMLNSFTDFEDWRERRSFFMKSFIEPGNTLSLYETKNNGYIDIMEERPYRLRYELEDHYGNTLTYNFTVNGKKQSINEVPACENFMAWGFPNSFMALGFTLNIPSGNLYNDLCYKHSSSKNANFYSDVHRVHHTPVPLHTNATMWIKINSDTLINRQQYGIVQIGENGSLSWVGGKYNNGGMETTIRELGSRYGISIDTIAPKITPIEPAKWVTNKRIRIRLADDLSGVASFRGEINGNFVLFTHDMKSSVYTYTFDDARLTKGQRQIFTFTATDGAGNKTEYKYEFDY